MSLGQRSRELWDLVGLKSVSQAQGGKPESLQKHMWPYRLFFLLQVKCIRVIFIAALSICKIKNRRAFIYFLEKNLNFWPRVVYLSIMVWCHGEMCLLPQAKQTLVGDQAHLLHFWKFFFLVLSYKIITHSCQFDCVAFFLRENTMRSVFCLSPDSKRNKKNLGSGHWYLDWNFWKMGFASDLFVIICVHSFLWIWEKACTKRGRHQNT